MMNGLRRKYNVSIVNIFLLLLAAILILPSVVMAAVPLADFTGAPTIGCSPVTVAFTNMSTGGDGPLSYYWEFLPDINVLSSMVSSTAQNPPVSFQHNDGTNPTGYASVRLTVTDADGDTSVIYKQNYITVKRSVFGCSDVTPSFTASQTTGDAPLTVNFTNTTTGYTPPFSYEWDFDNDGVVDSTAANPSHTYSVVGTYTVKLKATDPYGRTKTKTNTNYITVTLGSVPAVDFSGTPTSGSNPLTVNFTNSTTGGDAPLSYEWDFNNDGVVDSTAANPSHVYTASGSYTVKLKVTDVHGDTDTMTKQNYVFVTTNSVPAADFTGAPTIGCSPVTVAFTNMSTGGDGPFAYLWEFSDIWGFNNGTSTEENPTRTFWDDDGTAPYQYVSVKLTVTDADGDTSVIEKQNYITVKRSVFGCSEVIPSFTASQTTGDAPLTVSFTNTTTGSTPPFSYEWDFDNDGVVDSTAENPSHIYNTVGTYTVKLKATDLYGRTGTIIKTNLITVMPTGDISAGWEHTLSIKLDGTLWAWGHNDQGQLGDGTRTDNSSPIQIGTAADWRAVSAGWKHSLALKQDGTLWAWGDNDYGQAGDGTTLDRLSPVQIGSDSDWVTVGAGGVHNLAIKSDGTLWAWGGNFQGQLGDGTTTARLSPVQVGSASGWKAISAGWEHSVAVNATGSLWAWGWNEKGQLGDGTTVNRTTPVQIGTGFSEAVSAGWKHTVAVKTDGTIRAWGYNEYGQLGDGTTADRHSPVQIGSDTDWAAVAAGGVHTLALKTNGELWAWGGNFQGQIGDGTATMRLSPVKVGSATDWMEISAGWEHSAGLNDATTLLTWGWNAYGQTGNGTTISGYSPSVIGPVKIAGTSLHYFTIQNAYDAAINTDLILSRDIMFIGDLIMDQNISITLDGGYNSGFSSHTGNTTINGNMLISNGKVIIGNIILE